jgi:putative tributyrin esterase
MAYFVCHFSSKVLQKDVTVNVILPDDLEEGERAKTLYLLHGYSGDHTSWMRFSSIERYASDKRLAVIMPDVNNSYYADMAFGYPYFTFLTDELVRFMETVFPVEKKRSNRFVAGLSMGGYGAFKWAFSKPEMFCRAISLSGALDVDQVMQRLEEKGREKYFMSVFGALSVKGTQNDLKHLIEELEPSALPNLYIACGTEDFLFADNASFHAYLEQKKIPHIYKTAAGAHTWSFWDEHIILAIEWLLT